MIEPEHRVDLVVGQWPVGRSDRAKHIGIEVDLVQCDGIVQAVVEVVPHRPTSVAAACRSGCLPGYGFNPVPRMTHEDHF